MRCLVVASLLMLPVIARAEAALWGGLGGAWSHSSDVHLAAAGNDLQFDDVQWGKESFTRPLYFAARFSYVPKRRLGFILELVHDKVYADLDDELHVTGTRGGVAVDTTERLGDTFAELAMSHGLNLLAIGAMWRWTRCDELPCRGFEPYLFGSFGPLIPHVEVKVGGERVSEYQLGGFGLSGGGGISFAPIRWLALFVEYRGTWSHADVDVPHGALETDIFTHQGVFGVAVRTPL